MSLALAILMQIVMVPVPGWEEELVPKDETVAAVLKAIVGQNTSSLKSVTSDKFEKFVPFSKREIVGSEVFQSEIAGCLYHYTTTRAEAKLSMLYFVCEAPQKTADGVGHDGPFTGIVLEVWGDGSDRTYRYNPTKISPIGARPRMPPSPIRSNAQPKVEN